MRLQNARNPLPNWIKIRSKSLFKTCIKVALISVTLLATLLPFSSGNAQPIHEIHRFLDLFQPGELIEGATSFGSVLDNLPVVPLLHKGENLGYVFINSDLANTTGYSGKPIHILIAMDTKGALRAIHLVKHSEPIVLIGIPDRRIKAVLKAYQNLNIVELINREREQPDVDIVSGATVTIMVMDDSILNAAKKVARRLLVATDVETADKITRSIATDVEFDGSWTELLESQAVANLNLTVEQVNQAFLDANETIAASRVEDGEPGEPFIDLYVAPVSVPALGKSLLGPAEYRHLIAKLEGDQQAILVMAQGRYSFRGSGFVRGGIFDRFLIRQGDDVVRFRDLNYKRLMKVSLDNAPELEEVALFVIPPDTPIDITQRWQLELLVGRATGSVSKAFTTFRLPYQLPEAFLQPIAPAVKGTIAEPEEPALWVRLWHQKITMIVLLSAALFLLTMAFFFQHWLTARPKLTDRFRIAFLTFTLVVLGWYGNAQLSVVNILTVFHAWVSGFDWGYFLMEPLIFILWGAVAFALAFWGRGAYCGWLCPFGALQELTNRLAKHFQLPQVRVPWLIHERLWALKYIIFIILFGTALHSIEWAERLAEVEPFKTAIILKFNRTWPFVLFALATLIPGLFIERFYCRYLCPLGAALAFPSRMHIFEWLKRYKECGPQCQRCAKECMVQSIHPEGHINANECVYCMHCQVLYLDQDRCYKHIVRRKKREEKKRNRANRTESLIATDSESPPP